MQIIIQPLPSLHLLHAHPGRAISQRRKKRKPPHQNRNHNSTRSPRSQQTLSSKPLPDGSRPLLSGSLGVPLAIGNGTGRDIRRFDVKDELDDGAADERRGEVRGQVVVQEELTAHDEEGDVVRGPEEEEEAGAVIEAGAGA